MKILTLIKRLLFLWFKYGNRPVDMIIEFEGEGQWEHTLGELAYSPREKRVKLLSEGFT